MLSHEATGILTFARQRLVHCLKNFPKATTRKESNNLVGSGVFSSLQGFKYEILAGSKLTASISTTSAFMCHCGTLERCAKYDTLAGSVTGDFNTLLTTNRRYYFCYKKRHIMKNDIFCHNLHATFTMSLFIAH